MAQNMTHESGTNGAVKQAADAASDLAASAGAQVERAKATVQDAAANMSERGRVAAQNAQEVAGNVRTAVDKSVREQPMTTLAIAVAMGFVIGALWKS